MKTYQEVTPESIHVWCFLNKERPITNSAELGLGLTKVRLDWTTAEWEITKKNVSKQLKANQSVNS